MLIFIIPQEKIRFHFDIRFLCIEIVEEFVINEIQSVLSSIISYSCLSSVNRDPDRFYSKLNIIISKHFSHTNK